MFNVMCTVSFHLCLHVYYHSVHVEFIILLQDTARVNVAPEATFSCPIEEPTQDSNTAVVLLALF